MERNQATFIERIANFILLAKDSFVEKLQNKIANGVLGSKGNNYPVPLASKPLIFPTKEAIAQEKPYEDFKEIFLDFAHYNQEITPKIFQALDALEGENLSKAFNLAIRNQSIGLCAYFLNNEDSKYQDMLSTSKHLNGHLTSCILYNADKVLKYFLQDARFENALDNVELVSSLLKYCYRENKEKCLEVLIQSNRNCYLITEAIKDNGDALHALYDMDLINKVVIQGRFEELDSSLTKKDEVKKPKKLKI